MGGRGGAGGDSISKTAGELLTLFCRAQQTTAYRSSPATVFINKVLLRPSYIYTISFRYCFWLLSHTIVELRRCHRDCLAYKA